MPRFEFRFCCLKQAPLGVFSVLFLFMLFDNEDNYGHYDDLATIY